MSGSLIVGFEYKNNDIWKKLPGISIDLYQAYSYSISQININTTTIFTDIKKDHRTSVSQKAIVEGYVGSGILSFIEDIKDANHYKLYESTKRGDYNINNFDNIIRESIKGFKRLFVYYTGHAKNGHIVLPDNTLISMIYFRDLIVSNVDPSCQIMIIMDCCESNGMDLPYVYNNNTYKLNSKNFIKPRVLCISSSKQDEDSTTSKTGSIFTRNIFRFLISVKKGENKNTNTILNMIGYIDNNTGDDNCKSTMTIYASYPNIKTLWLWFLNYSDNNMMVEMDNNSSVITVTLNSCSDSIEKSSSMNNYIRYWTKLNYRC